ncbi:MAG: hypothetical protein JXB46_07885 [Candidatus Eisenbacteria bacterium]|nr:hypothetical protein [Candidatus Eisenbacteria bacterium]
MSSGEKKIAVVLVAILVVFVAAYMVTGKSVGTGANGSMAEVPTDQAGTPVCTPMANPPAGGVPTQEFGAEGAKVEIVAALPITHGCHVQTEAELKKAFEKYPDDVHLVIYDLFGREGQEYVREHGGQRAVVFVDGESTFQLEGRRVKLEYLEGGTYVPADIILVVEAQLAKS